MSYFVNKKRGFTLYVAILVAGMMTIIAMSIVAVVVHEALITDSLRDSQNAFYAADTGAECAIYWDIKGVPDGNGGFISPFASSTTPTAINCNRDPNNNFTKTINQWTINHVYANGYATSTVNGQTFFPIVFLSDPYCAKVTVVKGDDGTTKIESLGYNTGGANIGGQSSCNGPNNNRRVERAVRVSY